MKLGIIGLGLCGKTTLFEALTTTPPQPEKKGETRRALVSVPDQRIDKLSAIFTPKKTIYATIEYILPGQKDDSNRLNAVRDCDAFIHVLRNFEVPGIDAPNPSRDFVKLDEELIFNDLVVAEKRLGKIEQDKKRNRQVDEKEEKLLRQCHALLENNTPLRTDPDLAGAPELKGFAFFSARPMLVLINNDDDNTDIPALTGAGAEETAIAVRGRIEHEISQMNEEDAAAFLEEYNIAKPAVDRVITESYTLLGLISFLTVGKDEVRAWTIQRGTAAVDAAEAIHSDIKKGFIRAEVVSYDDFMAAGSHAEARKHGTVRLEGKTYIVQDGDIIDFRFNV